MNNVTPESIYKKLVELGGDWADKESAASMLEESRKSILAKVINLIVAKQAKTNITQAEHGAYDDPIYLSHVERMVKAREWANRAKVTYDAYKVFASLWQTEQANARAQNKF